MIRNSFIIRIKDLLNSNSNFSSSDFHVISDDNSLKITYEYDESFYIQIFIPNEISKLTRKEKETNYSFLMKEKDYKYEEYEFTGTVRPGTVALEEKLNFEGQDTIFTVINEWLNNLWNEITIQPQYQKILQVEEELENLKNKFNGLSEEFFSRQESQTLIERLNELETNFKEKLEIEIQDKEILLQTLNDLHQELEKLKAQTQVLNKKIGLNLLALKFLHGYQRMKTENF